MVFGGVGNHFGDELILAKIEWPKVMRGTSGDSEMTPVFPEKYTIPGLEILEDRSHD